MLRRFLAEGLLEAGTDEAGRGCLAGPVVAAAVILPPDFDIEGLDDSKKLTAHRRRILRQRIEASADWCVAMASVEEIDRLNILQASLLAMRRAIAGLRQRPQHLCVDGNRWRDCGIPYPDEPEPVHVPFTTVVGGDARYAHIAAASILAKTHRDELMERLAEQFLGYGWEENKGYPTKAHREALMHLGATEHHRRSFRGVQPVIPGLEDC